MWSNKVAWWQVTLYTVFMILFAISLGDKIILEIGQEWTKLPPRLGWSGLSGGGAHGIVSIECCWREHSCATCQLVSWRHGWVNLCYECIEQWTCCWSRTMLDAASGCHYPARKMTTHWPLLGYPRMAGMWSLNGVDCGCLSQLKWPSEGRSSVGWKLEDRVATTKYLVLRCSGYLV